MHEYPLEKALILLGGAHILVELEGLHQGPQASPVASSFALGLKGAQTFSLSTEFSGPARPVARGAYPSLVRAQAGCLEMQRTTDVEHLVIQNPWALCCNSHISGGEVWE
mmetsp:Transcript_87378/g.145700  ORF Transcript_87378/g.145700 Transcript_87378/m.145700 type:complete len:110 (+) Transcript_87378:985-1314(+)